MSAAREKRPLTKKPLIWLAVGGGGALATALFLARKRAGVTPPLSPSLATTPPKIYGETTKVALAVPAGWRRATGTEVAALPELRTQANALLSDPNFLSMAYGTLAPFVASDGKTYATWVEQHYHEPGGSVKPWGLHHGVTLLASTSAATLSDEWRGR